MIPREEIHLYEHHAANAHDLVRGLVGGGTALFAFVVSHLDQLEAWLRIVSLIIGIAVGIASLIQIIRRGRGK